MTDILQHPYAQAFARALVHFVWQGAALGMVAFLLLRSARLSASARHTVGVTLLALMLAAPMATTWYFVRDLPARGATGGAQIASVADPVAPAPGVAAPAAPVTSSPALPNDAPTVNPVLILALWLTGVVTLSIRLIGGWLVARRLAQRAVQLASPEVQSLARRVAGRLALDRVVRIVESSTVAVPVMVGWIKPVVILPTAALAGLTPMQVEALIAHELAHVCRHDYLVNLLQSVVETVLFYHPAVWWVSREVRAAREQSCDDLAVGVCDRLVYATALAELAAMTKTPRLALAAADGSLVERVRRILGQPGSERDGRAAWLPVALIAVVFGVWMPSALTSAATPQATVVTGVPGGVQGGISAGVPGGVQGGVSGGVTEGVVGGLASGVTGGVAASQLERRPDDRNEMLAQLLVYARRNLEHAQRAVEIGTMAGTEVRDVEATLQRVQSKIATPDRVADENLLTSSEADLVKLKFAKALRQIEAEEKRFSVGLSTARTVDEAVLAALDVASSAHSERSASAAPGDRSVDDQASQADPTLKFLAGQMEEARKRLAFARELVANGAGSSSDVELLEILLKKLELKALASQRASEAEHERVVMEQAQRDAYQANLAKLNAEQAQVRLNRAKQLFDAGLVSMQDVQDAEAAVTRAKLESSINGLAMHIEAPTITAPAAALRDRVLREGSAMPDDAVVSVLKESAKLTGDNDRAEVLLAVARQQTLTPEMVTLYVNAASGIRSDDERARVFKQPVRLRQGKGK